MTNIVTTQLDVSKAETHFPHEWGCETLEHGFPSMEAGIDMSFAHGSKRLPHTLSIASVDNHLIYGELG